MMIEETNEGENVAKHILKVAFAHPHFTWDE